MKCNCQAIMLSHALLHWLVQASDELGASVTVSCHLKVRSMGTPLLWPASSSWWQGLALTGLQNPAFGKAQQLGSPEIQNEEQTNWGVTLCAEDELGPNGYIQCTMRVQLGFHSPRRKMWKCWNCTR
jgi:hypothetical protein